MNLFTILITNLQLFFRRSRKAVVAVLTAAALSFGIVAVTAVPASASNAYVANSSVSECRIGVIADGVGRYLYPGGKTGATTDTVTIPAGCEAYHYYNGTYQRRYGPGSIISVGGVYWHLFYVYTL